jgi:hypothetical protein
VDNKQHTDRMGCGGGGCHSKSTKKPPHPLPSKYAPSQSHRLPFPSLALAFRFGATIFIDCAEFIALPFSLHTTHPNLCVRAAQKETDR